MQPNTLSFAAALMVFRAEHTQPIDPRGGEIEAALLIDMTREVMPRDKARLSPYRAERLLEFLRWMEARRRPATWRDVAVRMSCSRPVAYRLLAMYRDLPGVSPDVLP